MLMLLLRRVAAAAAFITTMPAGFSLAGCFSAAAIQRHCHCRQLILAIGMMAADASQPFASSCWYWLLPYCFDAIVFSSLAIDIAITLPLAAIGFRLIADVNIGHWFRRHWYAITLIISLMSLPLPCHCHCHYASYCHYHDEWLLASQLSQPARHNSCHIDSWYTLLPILRHW